MWFPILADMNNQGIALARADSNEMGFAARQQGLDHRISGRPPFHSVQIT